MCVAAPGVVRSVHNGTAKIDFNGNLAEANAGLVKVEPGDCVLVHAGLIIQTLKADEARQMEELFLELKELGDD